MNALLSSPGMHDMADRIAATLQEGDAPFARIRVDPIHFASGELKPTIPETVRGKHVFFLHPLQEPDPNTALMSMLLTIDALTRASVGRITLVLPYLSYLRQDRKDTPRVPISARLVADLIELSGAVERVITLDMHADQAQGFFSIPVDNIGASGVHAEYFREKFGGDFSTVAVVAPDFGSAVRARRFAARLDERVPVSIIDKRRPGPNQAEVLGFVGEGVAGKDVILYDDLIDTGGTIRAAMAEITKRDARSVCVCATHGLFSGDAAERFKLAGHPVVITPTVPRPSAYFAANAPWLEVVPIDALLAETIREASRVGGKVSRLSA